MCEGLTESRIIELKVAGLRDIFLQKPNSHILDIKMYKKTFDVSPIKLSSSRMVGLKLGEEEWQRILFHTV